MLDVKRFKSQSIFGIQDDEPVVRIPADTTRRQSQRLPSSQSLYPVTVECCAHKHKESFRKNVRGLYQVSIDIQDIWDTWHPIYDRRRINPNEMDLSTAYRYNQNMMEYYTCKFLHLTKKH